MYVFITNCKNFLGFYKRLFLGKPGTGYLNFSSCGLKQWNKGKTMTENHIPFLLGLQNFSRSWYN